MPHSAVKRRAEMLLRARGRSSDKNVAWGYECTDSRVAGQFQVASKYGTEMLIYGVSSVTTTIGRRTCRWRWNAYGEALKSTINGIVSIGAVLCSVRRGKHAEVLRYDLQVTFPDGLDHPFRPQTTASYACVSSVKAGKRRRASEEVNGMALVG